MAAAVRAAPVQATWARGAAPMTAGREEPARRAVAVAVAVPSPAARAGLRLRAVTAARRPGPPETRAT
ncbi:hypothetical protein [Streptomyces sp. NPDC018610]|uniref:hypothetical protein n=1 Tax=Streptomyces sp. NPDC018610 TaxID=3365049 RepID=UPI00379CE742